MYVLGGEVGHRVIASVLKFDTTQGTWSIVAPMPASRSAFAACAVGSDIYVFGGFDDRAQASVFKYDTVANEWRTLALMPCASCHHSVSVLGSLIYIVGAGATHKEVFCFDPALTAWSMLTPTLVERDRGVSFVVGGFLYTAGGSFLSSASMERYDVANNTWNLVMNMLEGRCEFGAAVSFGSAGPAEDQDLFDSLIDKASA
jgi:hypothetical protein